MLTLTPDILRAAYSYCRACPPFKRWKLPEAENVEFHILEHDGMMGDCEVRRDGEPAIIRISSTHCKTTHLLIETMAHECIHLYLQNEDGRHRHGPHFRRLAKSICRTHGFKLEDF